MKDIEGFEGEYAVTKDGRVWSYRTKKFLKPKVDSQGYLSVNLSRKGKKFSRTIHRLVATAYIPNPNNLPQVGHLDEIRTHSWADNLCWCTASENINYGTRNKKVSKKMSTPVLCVELETVFPSIKIAAKELQLDASHICKCCKNTNRRTGGYHFRRIEKEVV